MTTRHHLLGLLVLATLTLVPAAQAAAATPAPCTAIGAGKYNCSFYPAGNGTSGGAPVLSSSGSTIGYLHKGTNWVQCNQTGKRVTSGAASNDDWGWTEADNGKAGWVNAIYASGGGNDGVFGGAPQCNGAHGSPPGAAPAPAAGAKPATCSSAGAGHFNCTFSTAGNGIAGGTPVISAQRAIVGYLHQGVNWVTCQLKGGETTVSAFHNDSWAWTQADDGKTGWVNAVYASGGDNDGAFGGGTPSCGGAHGAAPAGGPVTGPVAPGSPAPPASGAKPATCTAASGGHYNCFFFEAGNGGVSGTPVQNGRSVVGYLHQGVNWVVCQLKGGEVSAGADHNNSWAWTEADNGKRGWVNAIDVSGGDNDGAFGGGTPSCGAAHGGAPAGGPVGTTKPPTPTPSPTPTPGPASGVRAKIVQIARAELAIPYTDSGFLVQKYGPTTFWCSEFLTWVWGHAGVDVPDIPFTGDLYVWSASHTYTFQPGIDPQPGDAALFGDTRIPQPWAAGTNASVHVAVVEQVFPDHQIMTINGDFGDGDETNGLRNRVEIRGPFDPRSPSDTAAKAGAANHDPIYAFASPVARGAAHSRAATRTKLAAPTAADASLVPALAPEQVGAAVKAQRPGGSGKVTPPAYAALPFRQGSVSVRAVNATPHGSIVLRVSYGGTQPAARRVLAGFLASHHDSVRHYVVHYVPTRG
jgi:hypothetical protein